MGSENEEFEFRLRREREAMASPVPASAAPAESPLMRGAREVGTGYLTQGLPGAAVAMANQGGKLLHATADAAGSAVTEGASQAGLSPEAAALAGTATNIGVQVVPSVLGGNLATNAAPLLERAAASTMQSALKPTLNDLRSGRAARAIDTMLEEGINATPGGVLKLRGKINDLNNEIVDLIKNSPSTVDKFAAFRSVKDTLEKFRNQVNPEADLAAIQKAWHEFLGHPLISGDSIPVQLAQQLKQGTYKILDKKYGQLGSAETEAQKAIARGLKEEIATAVPEVQSLNAQESKLLEALKVAERRALMDGNKNAGGLAWLSHSPATWAAFMADKSALFKSLVARMLNAGSERIPQAAVGMGIAVGEDVNTLLNRKQP